MSATRASATSAGWQQVNISRRRSSGKPSGSSASPPSASKAASCARFSSSTRSRRSRSIARLRAVVVIHAPGLRGTPSLGQRSSATIQASWTASSARSKSPRTRMSDATARPDSRRNRRSIAAPGSSYAKTLTGRTSMHPLCAPGIFAA